MRGERVAILDACVLVQAPLRDTLLRLAETPALYQPRWSDEIIAEMKRALQTQIGLAPAKTAYLERELRRHFADCWVTGFRAAGSRDDQRPERSPCPRRCRTRERADRRHVQQAAFPADRNIALEHRSGWTERILEELYAAAPAVVMERLRQQAIDLERSLSEQLPVLAKAVPTFVEVIRRDLQMKGD